MKTSSIILLISLLMLMASGEINAQPGLTGMIPGSDYAGLTGMIPGSDYAGLTDMNTGHDYAGLQGMIPGHDYAGRPEISAQGDITYKNYFVTDSAYVYRWDPVTASWQPYQVQYYTYTGGRLTELLTKNYLSGANAALSVYTYNSSGRAEASTNYTWSGDRVFSTRYLNEYDNLGRTATLRLQKWVNGSWAEERLQQNYQYDANNRAVRYETIYWRSNAWTLPTVSELSYNALGQLEYNLATRPGGAIDYRIVYEYNDKGLMTQFYTQYPAGGSWSNWNLRSFNYDGCGGRRYQIQYTGRGPDWIPSTKTEFFTSFSADTYPGKKVPVCHKGNTIWVAAEAVPAHLKHGDCIGECLYEKEKSGQSAANVPFTIYPNPARESFTIKFDGICPCNQARIELNDFSGTLIKSFPVNDNSSITIERGNLKAGHYFVRFIGDEVYSLPLIIR